MPPRAGSLRIEAKGLFPGAVVVRGNSWEWDDQDGGEGQEGNITEVQEFHSKYRRNVARVQWIGNGVTNVYRIGHNGKVRNLIPIEVFRDNINECCLNGQSCLCRIFPVSKYQALCQTTPQEL